MSRIGQWAMSLEERDAYGHGWSAFVSGIKFSENPFRLDEHCESKTQLADAIENRAAWEYGWQSAYHDQLAEGDPS